MPALRTASSVATRSCIGVRRADLAVELFARVEIVIHAIDAAGLEPRGLLGREQPQAGANLQVVLRLDLRHDRGDRVHLAVRRSAGRNHDAIGLGLPLGGHAGAVQQFLRRSAGCSAGSRPPRLSTANSSRNPRGTGRSWRSSESTAARGCRNTAAESDRPPPAGRAIPRRAIARSPAPRRSSAGGRPARASASACQSPRSGFKANGGEESVVCDGSVWLARSIMAEVLTRKYKSGYLA